MRVWLSPNNPSVKRVDDIESRLLGQRLSKYRLVSKYRNYIATRQFHETWDRHAEFIFTEHSLRILLKLTESRRWASRVRRISFSALLLDWDKMSLQRASRDHSDQAQHNDNPDDTEQFNQLGDRIREQGRLLKTSRPADIIAEALRNLKLCGHKIELCVYDDSDGSGQGLIRRGIGFDSFYGPWGTHRDSE